MEQGADAAAELAAGRGGGLRWLDGGPGEGTMAAAAMTVKAADAGAYQAGWGLFAILRAADGVALGGIGFHGPPRDGSVEVGYDLTPSARGAGWATDALRLLTGWALSRSGVDTVLAATEPGNAPSQRVLARVGFTRAEDADGLRMFVLRAPER
nr:GNAT family N-acetyltransferase [Streptomyces sp. SID5468]